MSVSPYIPHPALRPYVQRYVHTTFDIHDPSQPLDLHPIGHCALAFVLNEQQIIKEIKSDLDYTCRFSFTGQLSRHLSFRPLSLSMSIVIIAFKPLGAYRLLGVSLHPLANHSIAMEEILPEARYIKQELEDHASDPQQVVSILENWLLLQLNQHRKLHVGQLETACQLIQGSAGTMRIDELCNASGISQSNLEHHFKEKIGLSPKMYSRITRFINVNHFIQRHATTDWQQLVYRFDYFDQAHFIKEFKSFFGYSPAKAHLSSQNLAKTVANGI